jgi:predicted Zn finger-like uncharacterized protein
MPLDIECTGCQRQFRVPDSAAGKKIRCPKCQSAIDVPRAEATKAPVCTWYMKDEDGKSYGPITRAELDRWCDDGRVTADCQLLQAGSQQWQWAADVYPELDEDDEEEYGAKPAEASTKPVDAAAIQQRPSFDFIPAADKPPASFQPPAKSRAPSVEHSPLPTAAPSESAARSSRSKAIAGLLGIFLGPLGIHRFYLGYWGLGLAMLFTAGGCGVWSLIDAVLVILGRVNDADGRMLSE